MALGRRCELGCESWPNKAIYSVCPECGEKTTLFRNLTPLTEEEAESILLHKQFEKFYARRTQQRFEDYYAKHCAARGITTEEALTA